ncbi:MAG: polysaccharide deacetylase family protein [Peptostreptococcaceae bacterium]|nr:polysaccharide deacetylase family protein [Peptostreptococcaceae bacterium]
MKAFKKFISVVMMTTILTTSLSFAEAKVINQGNDQIKEMALTFDDGYSVEKIRSITSKLDKYGVKGTFFFVGNFIASHKEIIPELEAGGHLVVSHSFSHPDFTKLTDKGIVGEMENTKIAYTKATNQKIAPYFRPPYGAYNDRVLKVLGANHDLYVVMWTIDTLDWKGLSASEISNTVLSQAGNGKIVLMHTTKHVNTDQALDQIIPALQKKGYSFVRIDEMISKLPPEKQIAGIEKNIAQKPQAQTAETPTTQKPSTDKDPIASPNKDDEISIPKDKRKAYLYRLLSSVEI